MKGELGKEGGGTERTRNLAGKEDTGQAGLERRGELLKDRRQAYGQRRHDRIDLIERIRT